MIRFEKITKLYKQQEVISDVSLTIDKSELVVFIGPSGCGKTTMLKMINRLIHPTSGKIFINGEDTEKQDEFRLRKSIGYVIQSIGLFPHMTIRENIEIIPRLEKKAPELILKKSVELMKMIGLDPDVYLDRYPTQLSGGQQQRVGVARAFACNPDIILMDEPFSALDPITRSQLQDELLQLQTKMQKTIVFVTHDMDEAIKLANRICIIHKGRVVQYDTPENILKNPESSFVSEFLGRHRIWSTPELIRARDIMVHNPVTVKRSAGVLHCLEQMHSSNVDSLLIVDGDGRLQGIVYASDAQALPSMEASAADIMQDIPCTVSPDDSMVHILKTIQSMQVSTVPVLSEEGCLVGLITRSSLLTTLSQQYLDLEDVMM
ncbi:proline/glycine betaine ABC transporter ATP-binding protein [Paenibacillus selenitireducens]|uniref:Quaternary amine transport ATP-binding protein n=1 Tax=Paenibacillus selenitireducens TaxID=1324314 RepID=A0A1T2X4M8_9BACL|nr:ABC transporter ATP-binding protein [Paenibacillus selenitireducens]OPA74775.1 proline/glycine betaine ABC transporter ATP-binding protein [Paenibacillus selenitireducens]